MISLVIDLSRMQLHAQPHLEKLENRMSQAAKLADPVTDMIDLWIERVG